MTCEQGSSPRMRGAHGDLPENAGVLGIIPADAGSTNYDSFMYSDTEDHPRGCGEHMMRGRKP